MPDSSLTLIEKYNLEYEVLSDVGYIISREFGIVYEINPDLDSLFHTFGIDLQALHNSEKAELAIPATYVIDREGIIRYAFIDADHTKRAEPDDVLAILRGL
jgi:peroxiredoxin